MEDYAFRLPLVQSTVDELGGFYFVNKETCGKDRPLH